CIANGNRTSPRPAIHAALMTHAKFEIQSLARRQGSADSDMIPLQVISVNDSGRCPRPHLFKARIEGLLPGLQIAPFQYAGWVQETGTDGQHVPKTTHASICRRSL